MQLCATAQESFDGPGLPIDGRPLAAAGVANSADGALRTRAGRNVPDRRVLAPKTGCVGEWLPTFGTTPALGGAVWAMAVYDDGSGPALYAGGIFGDAGSADSFGIAKWDGAYWSDLAGGTFAGVNALKVFDDGSGPKLYAAGSFTAIGGFPGSGIACWNGSSWSALGSGLSNGATFPIGYALEIFDDGSGPALYVGGQFTHAGGVPCANVARWDGSTWSALDLGTNADVRALDAFDDGTGSKLYATGAFTLAGGLPANRIARWSGTAWSALGAGLSLGGWSFTGGLALEVFDDGTGSALYVGGEFKMAGATPVGNIARWNGASWSDPGGGMSDRVQALTVYDDGSGPRLYAGGLFSHAGGVLVNNVASWKGAGWAALGAGTNGEVDALMGFVDQGVPALFMGGGFTQVGDVAAGRIAKWKAPNWSALGKSLNWYVTALGRFDDGSGEKLYAGGDFWSTGGVELWSIAQWTGASWAPLGGGLGTIPGAARANALLSFDDGGGPDLYVGGRFTFASGIQTNNIARWNGSSWSALLGGVGGVADPTVYALAEFDGGGGPDLYVAGFFTTAGGSAANHVARWNGTGWSAVGTGVSGGPFARINKLLVHDDGSGPALYAVGWFSSAGGVPAANVARWDGSAWSGLGSGLPPNVIDIAAHDDGSGPALYAVGEFNHVDRWDGSSWSVVGAMSGFFDKAYAVVSHDDGTGAALYVGGEFGDIGGAAADFLAKWDGASWSGVSSGMEDPVYVLTSFDDGTGPALIAGGEFSVSSGGDSFVAKLGCVAAPSGTVYCTAGTTTNGCVPSISGNGSASASSGSGFRIGSNGIEGQVVGLFIYSVSGPATIPWAAGSSSLICVQPPLERMGGSFSGGTLSGCDGSLSVDWNAYIAAHVSALGQPFTGGETVWAQAWFRDPLAPKGANLSDGLTFQVAP